MGEKIEMTGSGRTLSKIDSLAALYKKGYGHRGSRFHRI